MSSDAKCSFCSKVDDTIHVICEKRCLICAHCQRASGIRQLLIRCLERAGAVASSRGAAQQCDPQCPLCHHPMAPNMVTNIKRLRKELATQTRLTASEALLETPNVLRQLQIPARKRELRSLRSGIIRQQSIAGSSLGGSAVPVGRMSSPPQTRLSLAAISRNNTATRTSTILTGLREDDMDSLQSLESVSTVAGEEEEAAFRGGKGLIRRSTRTGSMGGPAGRRKSSMKSRASSPSAVTGSTGRRKSRVSSPHRQAGGGGRGRLGDAEEEVDLPPASLAMQQQAQPPYTQAMALDLIVEVYVKMWNAYLQDNFEPISSHLRDALSRGRMSKNMVDAKVKNAVDFFSSVQPDTTLDPALVGAHFHHQQQFPHFQQQGKSTTESPQSHPVRLSFLSSSSSSTAQSRPASSACGVAGAYSVVNTHFYLFGSLLGLGAQAPPVTLPPQQQQQKLALPIIPMQGYIAVIVMVMAVCERCLRRNQLLSESEDGLGTLQPSTAEVAAKLCPMHLATRQPLTGKKLTCISLKKAISILKCLVQSDEYRFNMSALKSACVEYGVELPWKNKSSLSALLHCLVSLNADGQSLLVENYSSFLVKQQQQMSTQTQTDANGSSLPASTQPPPTTSNIGGSGAGPGANGFKLKRSASSAIPSSATDNPGPAGSLFPPVHLLAGAVKHVWEGKKHLKNLDFEMALSICKSRGQLISLPYFVSICVEAWRVELDSVLHTIKMCRQANLRRHGLKPHANPFQKSANSMKISHKKALKYVYDTFADKGVSTFETRKPGGGGSVGVGGSGSWSGKADAMSTTTTSSYETLKITQRTGINWEDVRERAMKTATIGAIPYISDVSSFLNKSNAELEHLTRLVMLETCKRREWEHLMNGFGWQDEWCWGGISIREGGEDMPLSGKREDGVEEEEAGDGMQGVEDDRSCATPVSLPLSHLAPHCSASVAVATVRRREKFRMVSPAHVEQSQWDVLFMRTAKVEADETEDGGMEEGGMASFIREKLYAVLKKTGEGRGVSRVEGGYVPGDIFNEEDEEEDDDHVEVRDTTEFLAGEVQSTDESLTGEEHDTHGDMLESEGGMGQGGGTTMAAGGSRGLLRRSPSIQELLAEDFSKYFKETNTRSAQIQRNQSQQHLIGSTMSPQRPKSKQVQKHFVVCDPRGGYGIESQTAVSQLYLKEQDDEDEAAGAGAFSFQGGKVQKSSINPLLTPITVAPYLEYRQGHAPFSEHGGGTSQWDSPHPVRHRVHLVDLVSAKNAHGDIFVKTGLLQPLAVPACKGDKHDSEGRDEQQEEGGGGDGGNQKGGEDRQQSGLEGAGGELKSSASAPTLQVLSSLTQLEFSVPPSQLVSRLAGPPLGQDEAKGLVPDHEDEGDAGGLIFRTMSPVGSRHRSHVDLGHFSHLRPSEHPKLSESACLQSLNLADSLLTAPGLANILQSLTTRKNKNIFQHLRKLDLSGNKIGDEGVLLLSDALSAGCPHLSDVSIRGNKVTDAGAIELLQAILEGGGAESLLKLDLGGNVLTLGQPRLAELLGHLPRLRVLDLSWNTITLVTFTEKASARSLIEQCRKLQVFSVAYNRMGDAGVGLLLGALENAPAMQLVDLAYCFCSEKVLKPLLSLIRQPSRSGAGVALIMLHGVALPLAATEEVIAAGVESGRKVILEGHHTGISINLKYN